MQQNNSGNFDDRQLQHSLHRQFDGQIGRRNKLLLHRVVEQSQKGSHQGDCKRIIEVVALSLFMFCIVAQVGSLVT